MSNWSDATAPFTLREIQQIIALVVEFYNLTGRWPTAAQIDAALRGTQGNAQV